MKNALKRNRLIRQHGNKVTNTKRNLTRTNDSGNDKLMTIKKDTIAKISPSNKRKENLTNYSEDKKDNIYTIIMDDLQTEIGKISSEGQDNKNIKKSRIEDRPKDSIYEIVMDQRLDDRSSMAGEKHIVNKGMW